MMFCKMFSSYIGPLATESDYQPHTGVKVELSAKPLLRRLLLIILMMIIIMIRMTIIIIVI